VSAPDVIARDISELRDQLLRAQDRPGDEVRK
jgi:hypothetical protein